MSSESDAKDDTRQAPLSGGLQGSAGSRVLRTRAAVRCALALLASCTAGQLLAEQPVRRIVSLNPCIDTILVQIAPREQIAALSHYSRDPHRSTIVEIAKSYPVTHETAEEIVLLRPDLVLASRHSALATRNALRRVGIRIAVFDVPDSVAASFAQIREVATAIGRESAGDRLIARIRRTLSAAQAAPGGVRPTALIFQPGGLTAGSQTLPGELLEVVGFHNAATAYGVTSWAPIPLEQVVASPPDLLLVGEVTPGGATWSERLIRHPALRRVATTHTGAARLEQRTFPARLLYCSGPVIEDAVNTLTAAREAIAERNAGSVR